MKKTKVHNPYEAVLAVTLLFLLLQYFFFSAYPQQLLLGTIAFVLLCLLSPKITQWVASAWSALSQAIGWVMSKVILSLVFFLLLTPLAVVYRLFKKNTFYKSREAESYFVDRHHTYQKEDLKNPW